MSDEGEVLCARCEHLARFHSGVGNDRCTLECSCESFDPPRSAEQVERPDEGMGVVDASGEFLSMGPLREDDCQSSPANESQASRTGEDSQSADRLPERRGQDATRDHFIARTVALEAADEVLRQGSPALIFDTGFDAGVHAAPRPELPEAMDVIEGLFLAGTDAPMTVLEQERLVERAERVLVANGRNLPDVPRPARLPERPDEGRVEAVAKVIANADGWEWHADDYRSPDPKWRPTDKAEYRDTAREVLAVASRPPDEEKAVAALRTLVAVKEMHDRHPEMDLSAAKWQAWVEAKAALAARPSVTEEKP